MHRWPCKIFEINTSDDHIHILLKVPPQVQLSKLVNNYKTVTSRVIRKEFSSLLSMHYWKPYFWSSSYFIATVSERAHAAVATYVNAQGEQHT